MSDRPPEFSGSTWQNWDCGEASGTWDAKLSKGSDDYKIRVWKREGGWKVALERKDADDDNYTDVLKGEDGIQDKDDAFDIADQYAGDVNVGRI